MGVGHGHGLVAWLRASWVAMILPFAIASLPSSKLSWFRDLTLEFARRGKIGQTSSSKLSRVPQRFFSHFYVVGAVWTTLLLLTTWLYAYATSAPGPVAAAMTSSSHTNNNNNKLLLRQKQVWRIVFLLLLLEVQALIRLYETFYVSKHSPSARMNIFGYLIGLSYYILAPLSLCCPCAPEVLKFTQNLLSELIVEGKNPMADIEINWWESLLNLRLGIGWWQWIGGAIFLWGWIHQRRCHAILGSLRSKASQVNDYVIPSGDWFEIVSSPHYLAEMVIYVGLVVASESDLNVWLILGFVVANLWFAAVETHKWYLHKFEDYPKNRFAIIPFIY